jgi:hypothetical protein
MNYIYNILPKDIYNLIYKYQDDEKLYKIDNILYEHICCNLNQLYYIDITFVNINLLKFLYNDLLTYFSNYGHIKTYKTGKEILKCRNHPDIMKIFYG